jgi:predicted lipoprotein
MTSNEDIVKENMVEGLEKTADSHAKEFAERVRSNTISNLENSVQGAEGLVKYVGEVEQERNDRGEFVDSYSFEINHPTAKLHERGGPIEPTYRRAMSNGWTRDGFYDALKDCEYMVRKKRYLRDAVTEAIQEDDRS